MDNDIYFLLGTLYDDPEKAREAYRLAARGEFSLSSAMYYNDQPPQMMYYAALALELNACHYELAEILASCT